MIGFLDINKIVLSQTHIRDVYDFLQYAGKKKVEAVALFAGKQADNTFHINEVIIPNQTGYILESGLMYAVDG